MARVTLIWLEDEGLKGIDPDMAAKAAQVELDTGGLVEAAVVTKPRSAAPPEVRSRLNGKPAQWLDLAGEVGSGEPAHRLARAAAAVARAAGRAALGTLPPLYTPQPVQSVLVAGMGQSAVAAAREAAILGHPVLLATGGSSGAEAGLDEDADEVSLLAAQLPAGVAVASGAELVHLEGAAGDFQAWVKTREQKATPQRFGAVVEVPAGRWQQADAGLGLDGRIIPVSQLDAEAYQGTDGAWLHAAVFAGVEQPLSAEAFSRAVQAALDLQMRPNVQVYLFFQEARVAAPGGERLYRKARREGVLCVRVEPGSLGVEAGGKRLKWHDALLNEDLGLEPDLAVFAEECMAELPEYLGNQVLWPAWERLAPEHARLKGGRTARSGFYMLGAVRGAPPGPARGAEAAAAAADLHARLADPPAPPPTVRHTSCASCLTCVRVCPHGAPRFAGDQVVTAAAACIACGICAAECPAEAIAPPGWSNPEMNAGLSGGLSRSGARPLVVFACMQSAEQAFYALSRQGHCWPQNVLLMPVVCAGRVGQQLIMKALSLGAAGVLVAGCHDGNCRSISGNLRAKLRTGECARLLERLELGPERVRFLHMASNQPEVLKNEVADLAQLVSEDA